jgi:predicted AlkP superfamily phosphohydrolase/phosphomutase
MKRKKMTNHRGNQIGSNKVFVVGLDGGTFDLVRSWAKEGSLPTFKRLMEEGMSDDLTVELPPGTVPNWPSFMTGKNAGKHGVIYWFSREKESWKWSVINSHSIKEKTIWEIVASNGKKFISINVPLTYPPKPINGLMITGLLTPPSAKVFTHPPELQDEICSEVGQYKIYPDVIYREGQEEKFLVSLMETLDIRFRTSRYLMDRYDWDLFMIVFSETDAIQHAFWKLIDPMHPKYEKRLAQQYGKGILQVYQKIDQFLADYLKRLEKGTTLMLMSDHGAGPFYKKFYTNNWLRDLGLLSLKKTPWSLFKYWSFRNGFTMQNIYRLFMKTGLANWRRRVDKNESAESLIRKCFLSYRDIDWDETKAFAFGGLGQIYLSAGEDKTAGTRHQDGEYEKVRELIIRELREVKVPGGEHLVEKIFKKEEIYSGPNLSILPDIIFKPIPGYLDPGDFEFFSNKIFDEGVGASGSHRQNGLFLIWGDSVKSGGILKGPRIHDLAPTILHLLGLPIPSDMDGKVISEALEGEWLGKHPIQYETALEEQDRKGLSYSEDEEKEIKEKLKGLGYLG